MLKRKSIHDAKREELPPKRNIFGSSFTFNDLKKQNIPLKPCSNPKIDVNDKANFIEIETLVTDQESQKSLNIQNLSRINYASKSSSTIKDSTLQLDCLRQILSLAENTDYANLGKQSDGCQKQKQSFGKIKKNNIKTQKYPHSLQIKNIFQILDQKKCGILSNLNCNSDIFSIELKYLIGSMINKIKLKKMKYSFDQFKRQFTQILEDIDQKEFKYILSKNQCLKQQKFKPQQKIDTIRTKINQYLNRNRQNFKDLAKQNEQTNEDPQELIVTGLQGSSFELHFSELNKHI